MSGPEKHVWGDSDVEVTPEDERHVDRTLEDEQFDPGEDHYGDWFSGP
jgi:hypothetical protein